MNTSATNSPVKFGAPVSIYFLIYLFFAGYLATLSASPNINIGFDYSNKSNEVQ
jgi:hypothetical protein